LSEHKIRGQSAWEKSEDKNRGQSASEKFQNQKTNGQLAWRNFRTQKPMDNSVRSFSGSSLYTYYWLEFFRVLCTYNS
ncbi:MAG: hypothetical protein IPI53_17670, partial [Saprospiraceae bacterium]|nr:hypothetical protein [Saprospiraceae bacterium]